MDKNITQRKIWLRLTLLGLVAGLLASVAVLLFRECIELARTLLLADGDYGTLAPWIRLLLPIVGGLLLGLAFDRLPVHLRQVGVVHVLSRLHTAGGERLPLGNLVTQFIGGVVAIASGHSVDREGPAVHIGAASANLAGQGIRLSSDEDYTLAACGAAAAIAAVFNTPLAGIVFVIEVLRVPYSVSRFLPIITASVVGAVLSQAVLGPDPAFATPALSLGSLRELPNLLVLGLVTGGLSAVFILIVETTALRARHWPCSVSFTLAGLLTGILGYWTPQIMGVSYHSLAAMLTGEVGWQLVIAMLFTKLLATSVSVGLRVPGGLIGPTLFVGGAAGSATGLLFATLTPLDGGTVSFYAVVGMVAMMGATLRAPLAALTALLELTANPNIILPGMLAVATAELTNRLVLGKDSVFDILLQIQQKPPPSAGTGH